MRLKPAAALCLVAVCVALAQILPNPEAVPRIFARIEANGNVHALQIPPVPNAPFSALEELDNTETLPDGSTQTLRALIRVARNTAGMTHQEYRTFENPALPNESQLRSIVLYDPFAGTRSTMNPRTQTAYISRRPAAYSPAAKKDTDTEEDLGFSTIEEQPVHGVRFTHRLQATGTGENETVITDENWYSVALRVNLLMQHTDPHSGAITMQLHQVTLGEPDGALFQIPANCRHIYPLLHSAHTVSLKYLLEHRDGSSARRSLR